MELQFLALLPLLALLVLLAQLAYRAARHHCQPEFSGSYGFWVVIGYYTWLEPVKMNNCCFSPPLKSFDFVHALAQSFHDLKGSFPMVV